MTPDAKAIAEKIADFVYNQTDRDGEWLDRSLAIKQIAAALREAHAQGFAEAVEKALRALRNEYPEHYDVMEGYKAIRALAQKKGESK